MAISQINTNSIASGAVSAADLADGSVTAAKLAAGVGGKVLQVVSTPINTLASYTPGSTNFVDTAVSASITPTSSTSKILAIVYFSGYNSVSSADTNFRFLRNSTVIMANPNVVSGNSYAITSNLRGDNTQYSYMVNFHYLDSPATTSSTTYKIQVISEATYYLNQGSQNGQSRFGTPQSQVTLLEIAA